ncbi:hypothetical protein MUCCIDRAFT_104766 [Mucor lusitanicus CBS 277.49]|uniref:Galactose oxidase n=1 Tax=Mucor lusitanicus CBS 277.49 TaxID=747725 RepID=A0A168PJP8_MUCCL|nr:hypothetical protein MUCCIDRAFT_104766 [Mucor lusitanicus CBS 277.49]
MFINGGFASKNGHLNNTNIMYNALENKWYGQPDYVEDPYGIRQIYYGSGSYVPGKGVAFYGGFEQFTNPNWTTPNTNASRFFFSSNRKTGYTQVAYFNIDNPSSIWSTALMLTTPSDHFLARHQSVFDPITNTLLFMGGEYRTPTSDEPILPNTYSYIKTFDTLNNVWGTMNLSGVLPTQNRLYSTLTLLPSTNRHVLLYGGETGNVVVVRDYCNILNLDTKSWTRQSIEAPALTPLQRSRHSAVLVNNSTLFVMWGIDPNKVGISSVLILNITNPDAITMSDKYIDPNALSAAEDPNTNTTRSGDSSNTRAEASTGLSSGAKAGIAVAAAVVAILGALVIWLYLRNKKNEKMRKQEQELARQQQQDQADYYHATDVEPMEVDWDQIEKYTEMPITKQTNNDSARVSAQSTTIVDGAEPNSTAYAVHPDVVEVQRPNAIDLPSQSQRALKPDGGY